MSPYVLAILSTHLDSKGYKVGRVDQAETALGAEMRLAADKSKGKASGDKGKDKIVRRYVLACEVSGASFLPEIQ